jgi:hypothetical protein
MYVIEMRYLFLSRSDSKKYHYTYLLNKGKKRSAEYCKRLSERMKGRPGNKGFKHSEESRRKMSEGSKGKWHSEETKMKISGKIKGTKIGSNNPAARAVRCIEPDKVFDTVTEATLFIHRKSKSSITNMLAGQTKTAGGYTWEYVQ